MGSDKKKDREKELMFQDIEDNNQSHSDSEHLAREKGLKRGRDDDHSQLKTPPQKQRIKKLRGKVAGDPKTHKSTPKSGMTKASAEASSSLPTRRTRKSLFNTKEEPSVTKASAEASSSVNPRRTRRSLSNPKEGSSVPSKRRKSTRRPVNAKVLHSQNSTDALVVHKEQKALVQKSHQTKVNLDGETKRFWKLIMKSMDYDGSELDEDRKKWWEKERRVIYERAHSFINRMRLVQGDRTFSSWRGSVVDSVVGVFLTHNVADHLSSSAFMDIAAEFPSEYNSSKGSSIHEAATSSCIIDEVDDDEDSKKILTKIGGDQIKRRSERTMDIVDWDALRCTSLEKISHLIRKRGMHNTKLPPRIKAFLNKVYNEGEEIDLEWLRDAHPDKAKEYLLSVHGLGLKSVECVRLLSLHQIAFPVDTNVARIVVRLGWVPLEPLPGDIQMHLVDQYPILDSVQKYLWPRLCKLDHKTFYELPDDHILLRGFDKREPEDKAYRVYYLLAIWKPGERDSSIQGSIKGVKAMGENSKTVRGTILIPYRTAMKGGFPLNGTYFQTNENPIYIRRDSIKDLRRCVLFCGSSVTACFKELPLDPIRESFWSGYVCVRGFDRKSGKSKALVKKIHCRASQKKKDDYEW